MRILAGAGVVLTALFIAALVTGIKTQNSNVLQVGCCGGVFSVLFTVSFLACSGVLW